MAENGRHIPDADIIPDSSKTQKIGTRLKRIISPFTAESFRNTERWQFNL